MNLRSSFAAAFGAIALSLIASCDRPGTKHPKVIILGFDGMDPRLCERLMNQGELPNLQRMRDLGGFKPLGTSVPPQSPVAWASFITGADPGTHGIFDFVHRDPSKQLGLYYSAAETVHGEEGWTIGQHKLPLTFWPFSHAPTQTLLRRDGTPFWDHLDEAGIPVRLYDIPANYPPSPSKHGHMCCLSGMGVPDLRGGYGTYQYFSEKVIVPKEEEGGMRKPLYMMDHKAETTLVGPIHSLRVEPVDTQLPLRVYRHPTASSARVEISGKTVVMNEGEWSDWTPIAFTLDMPPFLPASNVSGIVRFYLKQVHPELSLYVSPINIDPTDPGGQVITEPPDYITDIAEELGLFYTTGFQEDHKALSNRVFNESEYRQQAGHVLRERKNLLEYARRQYRDGLLFFYFSSTDLMAHMFWWDSDAPHPTRNADDAKKYHQVIVDLYRDVDTVIGDVVREYGDEALILVLSDHGFANFRRQFELNTWLRDEGYIAPKDCRSMLNPGRQPMVDWSETRAYAIGLNGLYVNLNGRERDGVVDPKDRDALIAEISAKLLAVRDPQDGKPIVARVYRREEIYHGPNVEKAPDLIVGYHRDYRVSWASTLGDLVEPVVSDNKQAWSADHCIAAEEVPGVVFANRAIRHPEPSLVDIAPTVLAEFGVARPEGMRGRSLFEERTASATSTTSGTTAEQGTNHGQDQD